MVTPHHIHPISVTPCLTLALAIVALPMIWRVLMWKPPRAWFLAFQPNNAMAPPTIESCGLDTAC
jgi:hypothetical protein